MSYISNDSPENAEKLCEYLENPNKDAVANETALITEDLNEHHKGNYLTKKRKNLTSFQEKELLVLNTFLANSILKIP